MSGFSGKHIFEKYQKYMPILCQEYMLFFCLPLSIQPMLNTHQQGRAREVGEGGQGEWSILRLIGPSCDQMVHPATLTKTRFSIDGN